MIIAFWLLMRDYSAHALFSIIGGAALLLGMLGFLGLGLLGKTRPDEEPQKSLAHVTQLGIVIAHGIGSHRDMIRLMRELSGVRKLPPPSHAVHGAATNEHDYVPLTIAQSTEIIAQIERGVEKLLADTLGTAAEQTAQPQIAQSSQGGPEESATKGKIPTS
jgi:hypothetical protein